MAGSSRTLRPGFLALLLALTPATACGLELKPYKDPLFAYPATLAQERGGHYRVLDYQEKRDINARDEIAERRVRSNYVSLKVRRVEKEVRAETPSGNVSWIAVGDRKSPAIVTLYVHGQGGTRKQGVDDFTFGGNFNRIKNLMIRDGGLYLSPDVPAFDAGGAKHIASILRHYHQLSPAAPIFVACGSMGAIICYRLAEDAEMARLIRGFILLGAPPDSSLFSSAAFRSGTPFFLGHGSHDRVYPIAAVQDFFQQFESRSPGYPVRLYRFETGTHGTPIRMIDWRDTLNWMLARM